MWDEQMPERTVLMTLALKSPETRQNKARAPGNSPVNVHTHVRVLQQATPSLPPALRTAFPCLQAADFEEVSGSHSEKTTASSYMATHTVLTPRAITNASAWC